MMNPQNRHLATATRGFGLVEVMVALALGLFSVVVILQVFSVSESQKRSTTSGADATTNVAAALYLIEREAKMAGWGMDASVYMGQTTSGKVSPTIPGCTTVNTYCNGDASCGGTAGPIADFSFASILINDGAAGGPDTVRIRFFANPNNANYNPPASTRVLANEMDLLGDPTVPRFTVSSNFGCKKGDLILLSDPKTTNSVCTLMQVSDTPGTTPVLTLPHKSTVPFNKPLWDTILPGNALPADPQGDNAGYTGIATCFQHASNGPVFERSFSIDADKQLLQRADNTGPAVIAADPVASGIVDMQAQYGVAADGVATIAATGWVNATGSWSAPVPKAGTPGSTTSGRLQNIKAVRVALLAKASEYQIPSAGHGGTCDATSATAGTPGNSDSWSKWATFNTSNALVFPADWRCYRYRSFELVLPLRNMIWANL